MTMLSNQTKFLEMGAKALFVLTFIVGVSIPSQTLAVTDTYQPQTKLEYVSYLQGVVDTLIAQLTAQRTYNSESSSRVQTDSAQVEVQTEVELSASFESDSSSYVYAWFEYGNTGILNKSTTKTRVRPSNRVVDYTRVLSNLESNKTYSYRAVFETSNGKKYYGSLQSFSTGSGFATAGGDFFNTGSATNYSITGTSIKTDSSSYNVWDKIEVSWTLPTSKADNDNWIGMFLLGSDGRKTNFSDLSNSTSGTALFTPFTPGTYEFRMFLKRGSDDEVATSRRITVRK